MISTNYFSQFTLIYIYLFLLIFLHEVPDPTAEDSTAKNSTAELYLPTTQNADSTVELTKCRQSKVQFFFLVAGFFRKNFGYDFSREPAL